MRKLTTLLVLGAAAMGLSAEEAARPFYGRATALVSQGDLRDYLGGKAFGYGYEIGYDWTKPESMIGIGIYGGYLRWNGDEATNIDTTQEMRAWRAGIDLHFNTPVKGLRPYAGVGLAYFDGKRLKDSTVLGAATNQRVLAAGPYPDTKAKFGLRLGVEYQITSAWGVAVDYNAYEWRSVAATGDNAPYPYKIKGYNPVHPSWVGVSVQYRFDWSF